MCTSGMSDHYKLLSEGKKSPVSDSDLGVSALTMSDSKPSARVSRHQEDAGVVDGCFKQALVSRQNSQSSDGSGSTQDKEEQRG